MGSRKAGKTHAEARERTRLALFRAGAAMLTERAARDPFAAIRVRELCDRAGFSTGAFYAHWPTAKSFYAELTDYFMTDIVAEEFDDLKQRGREAALQPGLPAVLDLAERDISTLLANPHWDAVELLNLTLARTTHRESATVGYRDVDALTGETYAFALEPLGREPRPPLGWDQVGVALQALIEGFGFRARVDAGPAELAGEDPPRLYAYAVAALLASLTPPRGDTLGLRASLSQELSPPAETARSRRKRAAPVRSSQP